MNVTHDPPRDLEEACTDSSRRTLSLPNLLVAMLAEPLARRGLAPANAEASHQPANTDMSFVRELPFASSMSESTRCDQPCANIPSSRAQRCSSRDSVVRLTGVPSSPISWTRTPRQKAM